MSIRKEVSVSDYLKCVDYSKNTWGSKKPGAYGKGIGNDRNDPNRIERVSKISELVVSEMFKVEEPDYEYRHGGDRGSDLEICGLKVDIKCSMRNYGAAVFKGVYGSGRSSLKSDIYIFAYLDGEDRIAHRASIVVVGYLTREEISKLELVPPRKKFTTACVNYDIKHEDMHPIEQLIEEMGIVSESSEQ